MTGCLQSAPAVTGKLSGLTNQFKIEKTNYHLFFNESKQRVEEIFSENITVNVPVTLTLHVESQFLNGFAAEITSDITSPFLPSFRRNAFVLEAFLVPGVNYTFTFRYVCPGSW